MLMDESLSLGVLGATGRGLAEHVGVPVRAAVVAAVLSAAAVLTGWAQRSKIEVTTAALSNAFSSVGGFCCGSHQVVDHQRLSGAAYCFSASVVPYLATAASKAVEILGSTVRGAVLCIAEL
jgi:serine palmitoyltransferase